MNTYFIPYQRGSSARGGLMDIPNPNTPIKIALVVAITMDQAQRRLFDFLNNKRVISGEWFLEEMFYLP